MRRLSHATKGTVPFVAAALLAFVVPAQAAKPIRITHPDAIAAYPHARGLAAQVTLRGNAAKRSTVAVRARCVFGPCEAMATANSKGRWKAYFHAILPAGRTRLGIRARYPEAPDLADSDVATLPLALPAWATPFTSGRRELVMIGDSLAEGTAEPLRRQLSDWWVTTDARTSRFLADGMAIFSRTPLAGTPVLAFSLFTNNGPAQVDALEAAVRQSVVRLEPGACAIWATIVRPKVGGVSYRAANDRLEALELELGGRLKIADWAGAVRRHPAWLRDDKVHATPTGYEHRARLYARAALTCN